MKEDLIRRIQEHSQAPGTPLPSVRRLAVQWGVSPLTMQRALKELAGLGVLTAVYRKGYWWGKPPEAPMPPVALGAEQRVLAAMESDMDEGIFTQKEVLPPLKTLASRYGAGLRSVRLALAALGRRGRLTRQGRGWSLSLDVGLGSRVALVVRCDRKGLLLMDTDRELDFVRAVYQECAQSQLALEVLGYWEEEAQLLDAKGGVIRWAEAHSRYMGTLVSTWLIRDVSKLVRLLYRPSLPLAVWWEQPSAFFRQLQGRGRQVFCFNLAFGVKPGEQVGLHLLKKGVSQVLFISPYHGSEWSLNRWEGLRSVLQGAHVPLDLAADGAVYSPWEWQQREWMALKAKKPSLSFDAPEVLRRSLDRLRKWLDKELRGQEGGARVAWVCVNDQVAVAVRDYLEDLKPEERPYLLSFDNSPVSFKLRIDSFAFPTQGMVQEMLASILRPSQVPYRGERLRQLQGWVACK